jgi:acyl carrier protein
MKEEIIEKLNAYITAQILKEPGRTLSAEQPLISSGIIDSFNLVDLAVFAEDTFGVHLDDMELNADRFDTLDELAALIDSRRG